MMRSYHTRLGSRSNDDTVALMETDIMRFMAILAFCLMAIFALVKSVEKDSASNAGASLTELKIEKLRDTILSLSKQVRTQQYENDRLQLQLSKQKAYDKKRQVKLPQNVLKPKKLPSIQAGKNKASTEPLSKSKAKSTSKKKFTLSFASDNTLITLLRKRDIALYAIDRKNAWKITAIGQSFQFQKTGLNGRYFSMTTQTVPVDITKQFPGNPAHLRWSIKLPRSLKQQIEDYMKSHSSGDLRIQSNLEIKISL